MAFCQAFITTLEDSDVKIANIPSLLRTALLSYTPSRLKPSVCPTALQYQRYRISASCSFPDTKARHPREDGFGIEQPVQTGVEAHRPSALREYLTAEEVGGGYIDLGCEDVRRWLQAREAGGEEILLDFGVVRKRAKGDWDAFLGAIECEDRIYANPFNSLIRLTSHSDVRVNAERWGSEARDKMRSRKLAKSDQVIYLWNT
ncbi:hypothetical protein BDN70DRAFT_918629 [Pholiota conissans]|uniref:Uncharacterized protein n=1 Tax=Pholiota conissans TaxID=109636 RepID=A0A9P5Z8Y5_9AGAR|nr:hypothetical protein BDN70DRAFT_918629 [Pholiota conissans]